ncbi:hypothetical protein EDB83DRAFT_2315381 [Lactarius deliciosus]|nr:hypothetical protein EDB83DRAFT_2315381 [Lactarius deliciosus]
MRSVTRRSGRPGMSAATRPGPNTAMGGTSCAAGRHADKVGQRESGAPVPARVGYEGRAVRRRKACSASVVGRQFERTVERELGSSAEARMRAGLEDSGVPTVWRAVSGDRNAGELSGGREWIPDMREEEGEMGKSVQAMSGSEMFLAHRPRQLGGRIFGDGGDGEGLGGLGYVGNGTWRSVLGPCGKLMEMEDYDVEDVVNGESMRLGVSLLNLRIKGGTVQRGGSRRRERRLLEARLSMWSRVRVLQGTAACCRMDVFPEFAFWIDGSKAKFTRSTRFTVAELKQWQPPVVQPGAPLARGSRWFYSDFLVFLVHDNLNMPGTTTSRQLSMKPGSRPRRLARLVAITVGVSLKNPTSLIPLDSTNSESSETVSSTKSSTTSSSIPLMTISTTHAKDKDVGLAQNAKRTQVLDLKANDAGEERTMLLTDLAPDPSHPFSSMGPASRRPDASGFRHYARRPICCIGAGTFQAHQDEGVAVTVPRPFFSCLIRTTRLGAAAGLSRKTCTGVRQRAGDSVRARRDQPGAAREYTCLAEAHLHYDPNVTLSFASSRITFGTALSHSSAFSWRTSRAGRRRPR